MFSAKTASSGRLKALFETLFSNTQTVCLVISAQGIRSEIRTTNNAWIGVDLPAESFDEFSFTFTEPQHIGLGAHTKQHFKSLKNKSTTTFSMTKPHTFDVRIDDPSGMSSTEYAVTVTSEQNMEPEHIEEYGCSAVDVPCSSFNNMCKSFFKTPTVDVSKQNGQISFSCILTGLSSKTQRFGAEDTSDNSLFFQQFRAESFQRIGHLSGFSSEPLKIYAEDGKCLKIVASAPLGTVTVLVGAQ